MDSPGFIRIFPTVSPRTCRYAGGWHEVVPDQVRRHPPELRLDDTGAGMAICEGEKTQRKWRGSDCSLSLDIPKFPHSKRPKSLEYVGRGIYWEDQHIFCFLFMVTSAFFPRDISAFRICSAPSGSRTSLTLWLCGSHRTSSLPWRTSLSRVSQWLLPENNHGVMDGNG